MGMTFKKTDSLEKLFEEFAIDPDKLEKKEETSENKEETTSGKKNDPSASNTKK